ncbi:MULTISPECIES: DinB family protein [Deinococcus]|uniref:DinB family protein n=1 Tax=Deinococcus rufus TaxID=2136097 RepID=A0ABV7Z6W0_9DEIO|nr:DinB family protein [Deinococcus sp. AB2017081]WQE94384.1 DinB family protein [Deinococcus sp. AB2017081]
MVNDPAMRAVGNLFRGGRANVSWDAALEGLSAGDAARVPAGLPHSVAQVVAHVQFWQQWLLDAATGTARPWPEHAAGGWPDPGEWDTLRRDLLGAQARLRDLARDPDLASTSTPQGQPWGVILVNFTGHGVYHLGQVVSIRQALGLWPPPGGGDTW